MTIGIPARETKMKIVLTKKLSLSGAPIDQNALRFSQMQYGLFSPDQSKGMKFQLFFKQL